jgi:hypothetical protein
MLLLKKLTKSAIKKIRKKLVVEKGGISLRQQDYIVQGDHDLLIYSTSFL